MRWTVHVSTHGRHEKSIQYFSMKTGRKAITWETGVDERIILMSTSKKQDIVDGRRYYNES